MAKGMSLKFALSYLQRSKQLYIPYFIAQTTAVAVYFIITITMWSARISDLVEGKSMQMIFQIGFYPMNFFIFIFIFYINSYLVKRRRREFGLYGVLGLEKRHASRIILCEGAITGVSSTVLGIIAGILFGRLWFNMLAKLLNMPSDTAFRLSPASFIVTAAFFSAITLFNTLFNIFQVNLSKPIDLLKSEKKGEKQPRFTKSVTLIGLLLLTAAYYIALTQTNIITLMTLFMAAVTAVIAATYMLFISGSAFALNKLIKIKRFYYKPNNFICVSGLYHRMRQNAAGLASVCILSTMVLVTVSSTVALFFGQEDIARVQNPNDAYLNVIFSDKSGDEKEKIIQSVKRDIDAAVEKNAITTRESFHYSMFAASAIIKDGEFVPKEALGSFIDEMKKESSGVELMFKIQLIPLSDYNEIKAARYTLSDNECLIATNSENGKISSLKGAGGKEYRVKSIIENETVTAKSNPYFSEMLIICKDEESALDLATGISQSSGKGEAPPLSEMFIINYDKCDKAQGLKFAAALDKIQPDGTERETGEINSYKENAYGVYCGLLFLGILFTVIFLITTILVIYFKQLSEGFEDKERFAVLQKVGMDESAVKKTVKKQTLTVFFLPLAAAFVHMGFCSKILIYMLRAFCLFNTPLTLGCIAITALLFAAVYTAVFKITSRTYFNIVKWER